MPNWPANLTKLQSMPHSSNQAIISGTKTTNNIIPEMNWLEFERRSGIESNLNNEEIKINLLFVTIRLKLQ